MYTFKELIKIKLKSCKRIQHTTNTIKIQDNGLLLKELFRIIGSEIFVVVVVISKEGTKWINPFLLPWLAFLYARMTNGYCFCLLHFLKYISSTLKCFFSPLRLFPLTHRAKKNCSKTQPIILSLSPDWKGKKKARKKLKCTHTVFTTPG